jgi:hypothetical protein
VASTEPRPSERADAIDLVNRLQARVEGGEAQR